MKQLHTFPTKPFGLLFVEYLFFMVGACILPIYGIYECLDPGILLNTQCVKEYYLGVIWAELFLLCMAYGLFYYGLRKLGYSFWMRIYYMAMGTLTYASFVWLEFLLFFAWIGYHLKIPSDFTTIVVYSISIAIPFELLRVMLGFKF